MIYLHIINVRVHTFFQNVPLSSAKRYMILMEARRKKWVSVLKSDGHLPGQFQFLSASWQPHFPLIFVISLGTAVEHWPKCMMANYVSFWMVSSMLVGSLLLYYHHGANLPFKVYKERRREKKVRQAFSVRGTLVRSSIVHFIGRLSRANVYLSHMRRRAR